MPNDTKRVLAALDHDVERGGQLHHCHEQVFVVDGRTVQPIRRDDAREPNDREVGQQREPRYDQKQGQECEHPLILGMADNLAQRNRPGLNHEG